MERFFPRDEIQEVRNNVDWHKLVNSLNLKVDDKKSKPNDIWVHSPFSGDKTASLHINLKTGGWYCHATSQGNGPIELVQKIYTLKINEACAWILEHGASFLDRCEKKKESIDNASLFGENLSRPLPPQAIKKPAKTPNMPTKFDLVPYLSQQGLHPEFVRRGISKNTCDYLGCGYLNSKSKSFLQDRIVFQVRSVHQDSSGTIYPNILTHIGRATTSEQETTHGKWNHYSGFAKTLELYNLDKVLLDKEARYQAQKTQSICVVEGCFDLAKMVEAGIKNCVATFGAHLDPDQLPHIHLIAKELGIKHFNLFYDRDLAGTTGKTKAQKLLQDAGYTAFSFDWNQILPNGKQIPIALTDPCALSVKQLFWLRKVGKI